MPRPKARNKPGPGKPQKRPIKYCARGHRQSPNWKGISPCTVCYLEDRAAEAALEAKAEREEWSRRNGPPPPYLTIVITSTGQRKHFTIPRHMARQQHRGPRRRARV